MNTFAIIISFIIGMALGAGVVFYGRKVDEDDLYQAELERDRAVNQLKAYKAMCERNDYFKNF